MKLHAVSLRVGQRIQCSRCHKMSAPVWAHLIGQRYGDYFCEECAKPHILVAHSNVGSGGRVTIVGPDKDAVMDVAQATKAGIDYMASPSIEHVITLPDGRFQASVRHFTLD
jgi:hypothetical protein